MKKLFIGLLIIAAGAGAFFYLRSKQIKLAERPVINRDLILGEWMIDSVHSTESLDTAKGIVTDSFYKAVRYNFGKDGKVIVSLGDFLTDTSMYTFKTDSVLSWDEGDSSITSIGIQELDSTRFVFRDSSEKGNPTIFLKKADK